jgi:hypothetical protein
MFIAGSSRHGITEHGGVKASSPVDQIAVGQHMRGHGDGFPPGRLAEPPS